MVRSGAPLSTLIIYRSGSGFARGFVPVPSLVSCSAPVSGVLGKVERAKNEFTLDRVG